LPSSSIAEGRMSMRGKRCSGVYGEQRTFLSLSVPSWNQSDSVFTRTRRLRRCGISTFTPLFSATHMKAHYMCVWHQESSGSQAFSAHYIGAAPFVGGSRLVVRSVKSTGAVMGSTVGYRGYCLEYRGAACARSEYHGILFRVPCDIVWGTVGHCLGCCGI
jgi:hypothetical protein